MLVCQRQRQEFSLPLLNSSHAPLPEPGNGPGQPEIAKGSTGLPFVLAPRGSGRRGPAGAGMVTRRSGGSLLFGRIAGFGQNLAQVGLGCGSFDTNLALRGIGLDPGAGIDALRLFDAVTERAL